MTGRLPRKPLIRRQSTLDSNFAMDQQPPPLEGPSFPIAYIGAGGINFGSAEGPWNHSFRFEHKLGPRLCVQTIVDPAISTSEIVLNNKRASFVEKAYRDTITHQSIPKYIEASKNSGIFPKIVVIGAPPQFRGCLIENRNAEQLLSKAFPEVAMFIEKPISTATVEEARALDNYFKEHKHIVSVGYMFRYLKVVSQLREIIQSKKLRVITISARYAPTYPEISKRFWWDKTGACGPIVEQATHFVDLCRFIGGEINLDTVMAHAVEYDEEPGELQMISADEKSVPGERRIPRATNAIWKFTSGAVGHLQHVVALHGNRFEASIDVFCDGFRFHLRDLYTTPILLVRTPMNDNDIVYDFPDDDPYFGEISTLVDAVETGDRSQILSSFEDAMKTYEATWAIRLASERTTAERRARSKKQMPK
ncbi:hypothetical protein NEOLI_003179 [Neolecta irregularis DAH-3]|uniref:Oxidoreductase n=1 Tax=Neolecta irregularis (strain DAH-3) TaxID=1198029 RepID=A0A1U7LPV1_NEOID|nr:hypothetical protein NEOLI_003179 [Neolecta irregularis DAH-3]|eukprot:OLL24696.1 hypothetical protein NEOLI_003179 [Neolecta irregularis DAH-3]